jgi:HEAT repeat protein
MEKPSSAVAGLVDKMPNPDDRGMYCTDIDKEKIEGAIAEIQEGGRENIIAVIDMLVPPGEGDDVKAHYALHCLALHVCKLGRRRARREFAQTLASQIGGGRLKAVQKYLIRELQVCGGREAVETLGKVLTDEELCEAAAQALVAIGRGAAEQLRNALPKVRGKCRLTVVQNLGVVRDERSVGSLREALGDEDREVRIVAGWGLANIGDGASADLLLKAADKSKGWERIQMTKSCLLLAERLLAAQDRNEAANIYRHLRRTRNDPSERYIKEAAEKALAAAG